MQICRKPKITQENLPYKIQLIVQYINYRDEPKGGGANIKPGR